MFTFTSLLFVLTPLLFGAIGGLIHYYYVEREYKEEDDD